MEKIAATSTDEKINHIFEMQLKSFYNQ